MRPTSLALGLWLNSVGYVNISPDRMATDAMNATHIIACYFACVRRGAPALWYNVLRILGQIVLIFDFLSFGRLELGVQGF